MSIILTALAYFIYPWDDKNWMWIIPIVDIGNWGVVLFPLGWLQSRLRGIREGDTDIVDDFDESGAESRNKRTVNRYMDALKESDHEAILACLTHDIVWEVPGTFHIRGKPAFEEKIKAFIGSPEIQVFRMTEEGNVVVVEGLVQSTKSGMGVIWMHSFVMSSKCAGRK